MLICYTSTMLTLNSHLKKLINLALKEDAPKGDITTQLCIDPKLSGLGIVVAKEDLIVCGIQLSQWVFDQAGLNAQIKTNFKDGDFVRKNQEILCIKSKLSSILILERIVLNFIQRLSSISTHVNRIVKAAGKIQVLDTRKTTPGFRDLEKYAVKIAGAIPHRKNLSEMIMIKDNHIEANQNKIRECVLKALKRKPKSMLLEVEVKNLAQLKNLVGLKIDILQLDNMNDKLLHRALLFCKKNFPDSKIEVTGNITSQRFKILEKLGVRIISIGSFAFAPRVDISMDIKITK